MTHKKRETEERDKKSGQPRLLPVDDDKAMAKNPLKPKDQKSAPKADSQASGKNQADLEGLNPAQLKAVTHQGGPQMIVAGAGTGKTMVISRRAAWLINSGQCAPEEVLALTFTDKAANEMVERIEDRLPLGYPDLWVSTFHAFCQRLLKDHALEIGLPDDFRLLGETDAYLMVRRNLERFDLDYYRPLGNPNKFIRAMLKHFSRAKDEAITPEEYLEFAKGVALDKDKASLDKEEKSRLNELANAYHVYERLLRENDCLDISDLILFAVHLFRKRPKLLKKYQAQFKEVIVDEFQDTNWAQYELLKLLVSPEGNITVVGDDDQSIYKFRGASVSNILTFKEDFPKSKEVVLTENYRSRQGILDTAYNFIQLNNPDRLEARLSLSKRLNANVEGTADVAHLRYPDGDSEAAGVVDHIMAIRQEDPSSSWSDFAILVRSNSSAEAFSQELRRRGLPFQFLALRGLYNKSIILDILAYFRLLDDYHESSAMYRTLSSPAFRIEGNDLVQLVHESRRKGDSVYEVCQRHAALGDRLSPETHATIDRLLGQLQAHSSLAKEKTVTEVLVSVLYDTGLAAELKREETVDDRENASFVNQFLNRLRRFEESLNDPSLAAFMEEFSMERDSGESGGLDFDPETGPDMVRVMTVHAAKGLEFDNVFIGQMADKRFPSIERGGDIPLPDGLTKEIVPEGQVHLQEERRLFYVAMTRAKKRLFFTSSEDYGGKTKRKPSKFLADLGFEQVPAVPSSMALPPPQPAEAPAGGLPSLPIPRSFSFTQLVAYDSCPLQYKYAHILRLPVFGKPAFSFGRTMHLTLERFMTEYNRRRGAGQGSLFEGEPKDAGQAVSLEELLEIYEGCWQDEWFPDKPTKRKYQEKGTASLKAFHAEVAENPPDVLMLEKDFMVKIAGQAVRGKIDRIDRLPDGTVELVDYKTGAAKNPDRLDTGGKRQLLLYQIAASRALGLKPSKLTFHYLDGGTRISFIGKDSDLSKVEGHFEQIIEKVKEGTFLPTPGWQCQFCDFASICEFRSQ